MNETETSKPIGIVVIGRNEGLHLNACLMSVCGEGRQIVYVDSGSTDESVSIARKVGVDVVELDPNRAFTAARARNEGMQHLKTVAPECDLVQFVDGDCVVETGWLEAAQKFLVGNPDVTIVCGRLRERFPERTIYNCLCDTELSGPSGEIRACGGIFMMRTSMFLALGGFREGLRAGEEPELCLRVRQSGGRVWRIDTGMALHDVDMHYFRDWWRRSRRTGYAYAEVSRLHAGADLTLWTREKHRALLWGAILPICIILTFVWTWNALWLLTIYPLSIVRIALTCRDDVRRPWVFALFITLSKFAEAVGILRHYIDALFRPSHGKPVQLDQSARG